MPTTDSVKQFITQDAKPFPNTQTPELRIEPKQRYPIEILGIGKEKIVCTTETDGIARMIPQPGKQAALAEEAEKIAAIRKKSQNSKNLAIDMTAEPLYKGEYTAKESNGDFSKILASNAIQNLEQALAYAHDLLNGLAELHEAGYAHGDLKPENVLEFEEGPTSILKLADFGKSKPLEKDESAIMMGNRRFSPPEQRVSFKGDVYGMGLMLIHIFEMQSSERPEKSIESLLPRSRIFAIFARVISALFRGISLSKPQASIHAHINALTGISPDLKSLLRDMTHDDPAKRPTAAEALERLKAEMDPQKKDLAPKSDI